MEGEPIVTRCGPAVSTLEDLPMLLGRTCAPTRMCRARLCVCIFIHDRTRTVSVETQVGLALSCMSESGIARNASRSTAHSLNSHSLPSFSAVSRTKDEVREMGTTHAACLSSSAW